MPFPRKSGQQQRVYLKLKALRRKFRITFLGLDGPHVNEETRAALEELCDEVVLLPARYRRSRRIRAVCQKVAGILYSMTTGLRASNFLIGRLELTPERVQYAIAAREFDCVLVEYWHAYRILELFHRRKVPCVLDMHNLLWRSWESRLAQRKWVPRAWKQWAVRRYRAAEEQAWTLFDALIAINRAEWEEVAALQPDQKHFYAPMGVELEFWPYSWNPQSPPRVAYYGGLGNPARQRDAMWAYDSIMPRVWAEVPETEFWLIGSNPPDDFLDLEKRDPRVRVTGYVERVPPVLSQVSVLLCPWKGTFGFRSRLIETMALGVPVVASPDAAWGMDLEDSRGIFFESSDPDLAARTVRLLKDSTSAETASREARSQIERTYSFENCYEKLAEDLSEWAGESDLGR